MKNIVNINGIKRLNKSVQKTITGGFTDPDEYGYCPTPNSFFCGVPGHICCNGLCVLPTHGACNF
ncbi:MULTISPECIES: hypothetical protein [Aquimarina]|uniref:Uncharacterized protein n=1 Tax=Aquimarina algiphila TaxID=2047982 RepID=A0A554VER9_9FLAO|nr:MULTISPECIES: hypothetical protein [Aquimarina]TSE05583.1 hypothetical protein FOF46_22300 [Aquimarina algiphila]